MFSKLIKNLKSQNNKEVVNRDIDAKAFKPLLKEKFAPTLRKYGFKGSGFKYRKKEGRYIYSLTVQASIYGGKCCIEMGVTIENFPTGIKNEIIPLEKIDPYNSHFRTRITPDAYTDQWWEYGKTIEEAKQSIDSMTEMFVKFGLPFYEQFKDYPRPLTQITLKDVKEHSELVARLHPFSSLYTILARYYISTGNKAKGIEFAKSGYALIDKTKRDKIEYIKDPETGHIKVLPKTPVDLIHFYEKLMKGELN